jgi:L-ascorbate metabolism protein UlaG (beta-lactamase superfamily)
MSWLCLVGCCRVRPRAGVDFLRRQRDRYSELRWIYDPNRSELLAPRRARPPRVCMTAARRTDPALEQVLPPIDFVLLSHMHEDHFDREVEVQR